MLELTLNEFNNSEIEYFQAANVLIFCDNPEKAKYYVDHLLSEFPSSVEGYLIKGWLEMKSNKPKNARNCFRAVLSQVIYYLCLLIN